MQTNLADFIKDTPEGREADAILRACVHCGFCTATCPTYQLLGDELDGPRGRIYLMKRVLEGEQPTRRTQLHLDRCLTCRNCETTCPSGVQYGRLVDIGRKVVEDKVTRPFGERVVRTLLKESLPRQWIFSPAMKLGQALRPLLPPSLRNKVPARQESGIWPVRQHARKMLLLEGCVQPSMSPNTNTATARVLDALGVELIRAAETGCCGAIRYHLNDHDGGRDDARRNIDAWWPHVQAGAEAIVINASGCGVMVKEYGHLLAADPKYSARAQAISRLAKDISEVLHEHIDGLRAKVQAMQANAGEEGGHSPVAWHPPCTLQHGQQIRGVVEEILQAAGVEVKMCADSHLCCGSAGTYSVLQPELAYRLRDDKLRKLDETGAKRIVSANIGCVTHLQSGTDKPVEHWIELVDRMISRAVS
ncbi:glycolate oxidase subunit GlcF [Lacisediminimonas profundi]|uniref:glycolate oxidase subunit GlcF n=1 Tax=Lacisediminimonas profundi TaxID=2603856 RepID=UPI00124BC26F|nr:glycolate oxidase subunit GlcF [Lacisediminimonas profundi]